MTELSPDQLPQQFLAAWIAQSNDLLALTDCSGAIRWANPRFVAATGLRAGPSAQLLSLACDEQIADEPLGGQHLRPAERHSSPASSAREVLQQALATGALADTDLVLRDAAGARIVLRASAQKSSGHVLWTFQDNTAAHEAAERLRRTSELLDLAQDFGRLGVWEREIPSGVGRWDPHVFALWGLDPRDGTPDYEQAKARVHPEDLAVLKYGPSTQSPGRYSQRYRVLRPDGTTRWIHSQWEVMTSAAGSPDRALGIMVDDSIVFNSARALGEANAQLELAVDLGRIAIWRHDLKTGRMHWNDRGFALLDIPAHSGGTPIEEVHSYIHADDLPLVLASLERTLHSDKPTDMEARYRRADGSWRYVLTRSVVQRDTGGAPLAMIGVALDVTERVEHLRNAEELARRLDAAAGAAHIGIWTTTANSGDTDWNAQMFELFDWPVRRPLPTLGEWIRTCVHPSERARVGRLTDEYLRHGQRPFEVDFKTLRRDGSSRWIVLRADVDRVRKDQRRLLGVALDVTEHHETLAALRRAIDRAALITRHAGIGTWESDEEGAPERWDEQMFHLLGLPPAATALNREEQLALVHPDDVPLILDSRARSRRSEQPEAYEFRVRLPDGRYRWLASRSAAVRNERGEIARRVGVNWDITETKNAESARQQAALAEREIQAKSQFLSRMSHELRTPLNAVLGFTQLLQIEAAQQDSQGQALKLGHIRAAAEHLLSLINDVLDLSSLESGDVKLQLRPMAIGELVAQSLPLVESLAAQHAVSLHVDDAGGVALIDPTRMRQVLINLLSNAVKYNRKGGQVVVETRLEDERVMLRVRDTGRGLTADQMGHMFEPFNRLGIENEGIEGTGIGLTIVKSLVESMGGAVGVSSKRGRGTVFEVALPAHAGASAPLAKPAPAEPLAESAGHVQRSGQLLYIEDNAVNVLLVEELVRSLSGLQIASEPTGGAGVARARTLKPDVILVDLQLPDFDGFEVLRRLRAQPETANTPCVALSANAMPDDIARGLEAGFADYWTKPINFKAFLGGLERLFPQAPSAAGIPSSNAADALNPLQR